MATVMDGIQTQKSSFSSILQNGAFTSEKLDGAGKNVVKRTRRAMEAMSAEYEKQYKKMKRSLQTKDDESEEAVYDSAFRQIMEPITTTRSAQGVSIVKAKMVKYKNTMQEAKWIVPPHSLVFAKRDKAMDVISAWSDVSNIRYPSDFSASHTLLGVTLEDGLDAEKFHREHVSRRYFSVAVEGVVSVQCPPDTLFGLKFGDPVYVQEDLYCTLGFYNVLALVPTGQFEENKTFARLGYFVEPVDKNRGGMRIKLAISKVFGVDYFKMIEVADSYDKDVEKYYSEANVHLKTLFGQLDPALTTEEQNMETIENFVAAVQESTQKFLDATAGAIGKTENQIFEIAQRRAESLIERFVTNHDKLKDEHNVKAELFKKHEAARNPEEKEESGEKEGSEAFPTAPTPPREPTAPPDDEAWDKLLRMCEEKTASFVKEKEDTLKEEFKWFADYKKVLEDDMPEELRGEIDEALETYTQVLEKNYQQIEKIFSEDFATLIKQHKGEKADWPTYNMYLGYLDKPGSNESVAQKLEEITLAKQNYIHHLREKLAELVNQKIGEDEQSATGADTSGESLEADLKKFLEAQIDLSAKITDLMDMKWSESHVELEPKSNAKHFTQSDRNYARQLKLFKNVLENVYRDETLVLSGKKTLENIGTMKFSYNMLDNYFANIVKNAYHDNTRRNESKKSTTHWESKFFNVDDSNYVDFDEKTGNFTDKRLYDQPLHFLMGRLVQEKLNLADRYG